MMVGTDRWNGGIIDVWRRKKPEFYMTRKAYSPIKVIHSEVKAQEKKGSVDYRKSVLSH